MVVEFFARVVCVDVDAETVQVVGAVLDAEDAPCGGVLGDADRVAQAPADEEARGGVVVGAGGGGEAGDVEGADLGDARGLLGGEVVHVLAAASGDEEEAGLLAGEEEGARDVAAVWVGHVLDYNLSVCYRNGVGVIVPAVDVLDGGSIEGLAVL